jgi:hypothetical protein
MQIKKLNFTDVGLLKKDWDLGFQLHPKTIVEHAHWCNIYDSHAYW